MSSSAAPLESVSPLATLSVDSRRRFKNHLMTVVIVAAFLVALAPLLSLLYEVVHRGMARFDADFFTTTARGAFGAEGGAAHAIVGTLVITATASVIAVPIGLMAAIYLNEYGEGRLRRALTFFVDVMTGIPSIVAGLFAYALFELFFGPGIRLGIMGSVALAVLMVPIVIRSAEEILKVVPNHLREASYALGTPKWRTITKVVLPTALAGLVTGVMLAVARIIGETAPLLVTTGVVDSMNADPFEGRMQNLAVYAFNEYRSPGVDKEAAFDRAWAAALTLLLIVIALNLIARLVYRRFGTEARP
jgi:phosphate transport system permease protein